MLDLFIGRRELGKTTLAVSVARHFPTRIFFDPRHMLHTCPTILYDENLSGLREALDTQSEIVVRPDFEVEETFETMCREIYEWLRENPSEKLCLLVDESRFVREPEKVRYFDYIVRCTKRDLVTVEMTCHGVVDISPNLRRIADLWILFQLTQGADIDTVRERCGDAVADAVQSLKPYEYIVWDDSLHRFQKHSDAASWYVSLEQPVNAINT
jgi:hypothetical protein